MNYKKIFSKLIPIIIVAIFILGVAFVEEDKNVFENKDSNTNLTLTFFNVGQGDASLIKTRQGKKILIDAGPDDLLINVIPGEVGFFDKKIDFVIITHPHADHLAGLNYFFQIYEIENIYLSGYSHNSPDYLELLENIKKEKSNILKAEQGKDLLIDEVSLKFLWPPAEFDKKISDLNDTSVVISLKVKESSVLFLGDLSKKYQQALLEKGYFENNYEIIKVAHHGASDGISESLVEKTLPIWSIISVGGNNNYNHPSSKTLKILESTNILRTDQEETIKFIFNGRNFIRI